jgi:N-methylhydantoinase A/oxoprolinase/acetone carboxylase beta subunit
MLAGGSRPRSRPRRPIPRAASWPGSKRFWLWQVLRPGAVDLIIHGTTLATNALIERTGARAALITALGHRDALEMAHENRYDQYDLDADRPPPLVPRALRWPVRERVDWRGRALTSLDEASVGALLPQIETMAVESIAIGLLHAFANPDHVRRIRDRIAAAHPALSITLASQPSAEGRAEGA